MAAINKAVRRQLILSIILTICFIGGIPSIILGAVFKIWVVMGLGIAAAVVGFYGTPMAWMNYGDKLSYRRMVGAICEEHLYTVGEIAQQLALQEKTVRARLNVCFNKSYLVGFKREGDRIIPNENMAPQDILHSAECPNCGAKFSFKGKSGACPYCGGVYEFK